jgi:hypothetical protein
VNDGFHNRVSCSSIGNKLHTEALQIPIQSIKKVNRSEKVGKSLSLRLFVAIVIFED